jgi:hypothetical protein
MATVSVEVNLNEFSEYEIIEELEKYGYTVLGDDAVLGFQYELDRGNLRECLVEMEKYIPGLRGLVYALDKITNA